MRRRAVLGSAVAAVSAALASVPSRASAGTSRRAAPGSSGATASRVDVHCHHIPDFYRASLDEHDAGDHFPDWSPELAVSFMDTYGIGTQVVSISTPACTYLDARADRTQMARRLNDWTSANLVHSTVPSRVGRFGAFAVLPLGKTIDDADVAAACAEAERAVKVLGLDGIGLLSSYGETYLGDPVLDPLFKTVEQLGVLTIVHPTAPAAMPAVGKPALPAFLIEFTFDTTRAAVNMSYHRTYLKFPRLRLQFSHSGGTLPFVSWRATMLSYQIPTPEQSFDYGRHFYDTALSWGPDAQLATKLLAGSEHVMFGTDWPFTDAVWAADGDKATELGQTWSDGELAGILRDNALTQLPTLKARLSA